LDDIIKALGDVTTTYINQGNSWKVSNNYALPKPIQTSKSISNSPAKLLDINALPVSVDIICFLLTVKKLRFFNNSMMFALVAHSC
jgi:hypothetical protein